MDAVIFLILYYWLKLISRLIIFVRFKYTNYLSYSFLFKKYGFFFYFTKFYYDETLDGIDFLVYSFPQYKYISYIYIHIHTYTYIYIHYIHDITYTYIHRYIHIVRPNAYIHPVRSIFKFVRNRLNASENADSDI